MPHYYPKYDRIFWLRIPFTQNFLTGSKYLNQKDFPKFKADWSFENISCAEWQIQHIYKWPSQVFALNEVVSLESQAESPGKSLTPDVKEKYFEWCQKDISLAGILRQKRFDLLIFLQTDASTRVLEY